MRRCRVEGRGAATIHDVTVSMARGQHTPTSSPKLTELLKKREKTANALKRCEKSLASLQQYLDSLTVEHLEVSKLADVLESYDSTGERLDAKKSELSEELRLIDVEIEEERVDLAAPQDNDKLRTKAAIGVFAQTAGNVEIALIYGECSFSGLRSMLKFSMQPCLTPPGRRSMISASIWRPKKIQLRSSTRPA
jgi:predicted nuclease with TOPRIM domain